MQKIELEHINIIEITFSKSDTYANIKHRTSLTSEEKKYPKTPDNRYIDKFGALDNLHIQNIIK